MPLARVGSTTRDGMLCACLVVAALAAWPQRASALELQPVNLVPPLITGAPVVGQTLACTQGTWAGPPSSYAHQWTRDGSDVPGASAASYTVSSADVAKRLRCRVTASNSMGSAAATSLPVVGLALGSATDPPSSGSPPGAGPSPPGAGELIRLPRARRCVGTRRLKIRIKKIAGVKPVAVAVYVNGKPVKVVRGKRLRSTISLRGLPGGTVRVRIEVATADGRVIRQTRRYRTCARKAKKRASKRRQGR